MILVNHIKVNLHLPSTMSSHPTIIPFLLYTGRKAVRKWIKPLRIEEQLQRFASPCYGKEQDSQRRYCYWARPHLDKSLEKNANCVMGLNRIPICCVRLQLFWVHVEISRWAAISGQTHADNPSIVLKSQFKPNIIGIVQFVYKVLVDIDDIKYN